MAGSTVCTDSISPQTLAPRTPSYVVQRADRERSETSPGKSDSTKGQELPSSSEATRTLDLLQRSEEYGASLPQQNMTPRSCTMAGAVLAPADYEKISAVTQGCRPSGPPLDIGDALINKSSNETCITAISEVDKEADSEVDSNVDPDADADIVSDSEAGASLAPWARPGTASKHLASSDTTTAVTDPMKRSSQRSKRSRERFRRKRYESFKKSQESAHVSTQAPVVPARPAVQLLPGKACEAPQALLGLSTAAHGRSATAVNTAPPCGMLFDNANVMLPPSKSSSYTARRTSGSSQQHPQKVNVPANTVPPKPPVCNSIHALASAAVASAFASKLPRGRTPSPSPSPIAISSFSTSAQTKAVPSSTPPRPPITSVGKTKTPGISTPEKRVSPYDRTITKPKTSGQDKGNISNHYSKIDVEGNSDEKEIKIPDKKTSEIKTPESKTPEKPTRTESTQQDGRAVSKIKSKMDSHDKGLVKVKSDRRPRHTKGKPTSLPLPPRPNMSMGSEQPKRARRLSLESLEDSSERPRKRVSFGKVSYCEPEVPAADPDEASATPSQETPQPTVPVKSAITVPVVPPEARLFFSRPLTSSVPDKTSDSDPRNISPSNDAQAREPSGATAPRTAVPLAALQELCPEDSRNTVRHAENFEAAKTTTPGSDTIGSSTDASTTLEVAIRNPKSLFVPKAPDSRVFQIADLLLSMNNQTQGTMAELKRLMEPDIEDFVIGCHLDLFEAQLRALNLASYTAWIKLMAKQGEDENAES